jgi:hypothetical protein
MSEDREAQAFLILTDIGGYTDFLSFDKLDLSHAQFVITKLLEAVLDHARPPLNVSKLEGDAIFLYAEDDGAKVGPALNRFMESFLAKREEMHANNTCHCKACRSIAQLELKILVHYGQVLFHKVHNFTELAGVDVILVHRLLKNSVPGRRYILSTESAYPAISAHLPEGAQPHLENCEGVGSVPTFLLLLAPHDAPRKSGSLFSKIIELIYKDVWAILYRRGLIKGKAGK